MNRLTRCLRAVQPLVTKKSTWNAPLRTMVTNQLEASFSRGALVKPIKSHALLFQISRQFHQGRYLLNTKAEDGKEEAPQTDQTEKTEPETKTEETPEPEVDYQKIIKEKDAAILEAKDQLLRTLADMENLRYRSKKEIETKTKYAAGDTAKHILEVSDNLTLALNSVQDDVADDSNPKFKSFYEGVKMTEKTLLNSMNKIGVTRLDVMGKKFDPKVHDCLYDYVDESARPGTVGNIVKDGFMIKDRVLRAAQVGVIKGTYVLTEEEKAAAEAKAGKK